MWNRHCCRRFAILIMEVFERLPYKCREEWLEMRGNGIGGSDCSAIFGCNPYKSNIQLYREKAKLIRSVDYINKFTEYGTLCENPIRLIFKADFKNRLEVKHTKELLVRKDKPFLRGSLDGELIVKNNFLFQSYWKSKRLVNDTNEEPKIIELKKGMKGVLEIKTSDVIRSQQKEKWDNQIPQNYYCQVLHYMLITGWDFFILRVQLTFTDSEQKQIRHETRDYGLLREDVITELKWLEQQEDSFWNNNILPGKEPDLIISI